MTKEEILRGTDLFLLDLDGTVYLDETPIGDMKNTLMRLRKAGKQLVYLTNNSSKTEKEYREKLVRVGLFETGDGVYTSGMATVAELNSRYAGKSVYLLGTEALKEEFRAAGVPLKEDAPEIAVLAYDVTLTFEKLKKFNEFLAGGAVYLATHPDDVCPTKGVPMPDVGSLIALFERTSGRHPDEIVGKPYPTMGRLISETYKVPCARACMVGDRMHTDIRFANNCGMKSILVLSGETTRESMGKYPDKPDLVLSDLNAICGDH